MDESLKMLMENIEVIIENTSNADDRSKAELIKKRIKDENISPDDVIEFISTVDEESLHI